MGLYTLRAGALAFSAVSVAGLLRVVCVATASFAIDTASVPWAQGARVLATAQWVVDVLAMGLALAVLALHPQRGRRLAKPRWALLGIVGTLPLFFLIGVALGADDPERTGWVALVSNVAHHNRVLPTPYLPVQLRNYVEALRWVSAAALIVVAPRSRLMAGALALALFTRSTLEVPLCAAAAVIGALAVGLHPGPDPVRELRGGA
jgi:hypothetical protein